MFKFSFQIKTFEKTECHDERRKLAKEIYDNFIMKEMLSHTHVSIGRNFSKHSNMFTYSYWRLLGMICVLHAYTMELIIVSFFFLGHSFILTGIFQRSCGACTKVSYEKRSSRQFIWGKFICSISYRWELFECYFAFNICYLYHIQSRT